MPGVMPRVAPSGGGVRAALPTAIPSSHADYHFVVADQGPRFSGNLGSTGLRLEMSHEGLLSLSRQLRGDIVRRLMRKAGKAATRVWATKSGWPGLRTRFDPAYAQRLQLTQRNIKYLRRCEKAWGRWYPYLSPHRAKPGGHLAQNIKAEKSGWRVVARNIPGQVVVDLKLPAARVLNLLNRVVVYKSRAHKRGDTYTKGDRVAVGTKDLSKYREEFLRTDHPSNAEDVRFLRDTMRGNFLDEVRQLNASPRRWRNALAEPDGETA